jgi:hypothetical protein
LRKSKEELEREINETPYFTLTNDRDSAARETAKNKLVLAIFDYCKNYWYSSPGKWATINDKYQIKSEIGMVITECLIPGRFDPDKGIPFTHYLNTSIKNAIKRCKKGDFQDNENRDDGDNWDKPIPEIENIEAPKSKKEEAGALIQKQTIHNILSEIDKMFKNRQDRVKPYLRALLTLKMLKLLDSIESLPSGYEFIDYGFFEKYSKENKLPTQKEVAALFGRDETDASRTLSKFSKRIEHEIKKTIQEENS